jgi:hypothetical protein
MRAAEKGKREIDPVMICRLPSSESPGKTTLGFFCAATGSRSRRAGGAEKRLSPLWPGSSPGRFVETSPGMILFHQKSGFSGIIDQTRLADSKYLEFKKIIVFYGNPLLLFRLKERSSKAPSLVSQPGLAHHLD